MVIVEWSIVTGAIDIGSVQEGRDRNVDRIERGGCVDGVSISLVRAMSRGDKIMPARPAAETATAKEESGEGEERMSSPIAEVEGGEIWKERLESGNARRAEIKDREKVAIVERRIV